MARLCAAYNTPPTPARKDAYWRAFGKKTLAEFARMVDLALDADDIDGMPTVPQLRRLRYRQPAGMVVATQAKDDRDKLLHFANRLCFALMLDSGGFGSKGAFRPGEGDSFADAQPSSALTRIREATLALVEWFSEPVLEGDTTATAAAFIEQYTRAVSGIVHVPAVTLKRWRELAERPEAQEPLPAYMARDFKSRPQLELAP